MDYAGESDEVRYLPSKQTFLRVRIPSPVRVAPTTTEAKCTGCTFRKEKSGSIPHPYDY